MVREWTMPSRAALPVWNQWPHRLLLPHCVASVRFVQDRPLSRAPSAPSESKEGPPFLDLGQDRLLSVHPVAKRPFRLGGGRVLG